MSTTFTIISTCAILIRLFVMAKENMPEMKTSMDCVKSMSVQLSVFGRFYDLGLDPIAAYLMKTYHFIRVFEFVHNVPRRGKALLPSFNQRPFCSPRMSTRKRRMSHYYFLSTSFPFEIKINVFLR